MQRQFIVGSVVTAVILGGLALTFIASSSGPSEVEAEVDTLESELAILSSSIDKQNAALKDQQEQIDYWAGQASQLESQLQASQVSDQSAVNDKIESLLTAVSAIDSQYAGQLDALESEVTSNSDMLGWKGNYANGLWGDMETVLGCLEEIIEYGGVRTIPNNACRLIEAGLVGGY